MSSRALRKLQGRGEVMAIVTSDEESDEDNEVNTENNNEVNTGNKFALLHASDENNSPTEDVADIPQTNGENLNKKKRNKKKKKRKKQNPQQNDNDQDIEQVLQEIQGESPNASSSVSTTSDAISQSQKSVLIVEHRLLNPDNELRRIFGSRAVMGDAAYRRRNRGNSHRGMWLSQPQSNWVKMSKVGLSMNLIETKNGSQYFKFEHNKEYQQIQFKFLDAVDSSDHRNIATVLEQHNYHVDSLITFSDVYKVHDDVKMARELIERALYCLERSFHSCFNLTTSNCKLQYKYPENRCLFLALYKHMNFVSQRGCNRTALELSKLLLSFDPREDPLGVILLIDYFAIRAAENEFLIRFAEEWGADRNLDLLPNWAFSLAFAQFNLADSGSNEKADKSLQDALIKFPTVLLALLEECSVHADEEISKHPFFTSQANDSTPRGLALLCRLFVARNHMLWKDPDTITWVLDNAKMVVQRVGVKETYIADCVSRRKSRYQKPPLNIYRHAMISEIPGISSLLPLEIRMGTMLSHDPLPPVDTVVSYTRPARSTTGGSRANPVSLFFHSLLPGFNPDEEVAMEDAEMNGGGHGEAVRGNIQTLMHAMRDLLQSFQGPGEGSEEEEFNEEWD